MKRETLRQRKRRLLRKRLARHRRAREREARFRGGMDLWLRSALAYGPGREERSLRRAAIRRGLLRRLPGHAAGKTETAL